MAGQSTPQETQARKILRELGLTVEAVSWVHRREEEFAALVSANEKGFERQYERVMEVLTDPKCPLRVVRETVGRYDTRTYVAFAAKEA